MSIVIQKFGGSVLGTSDDRRAAANIVKRKREEGKFPVVVLSALGRPPMAYSTDVLVSLLEEAVTERDLRELDLLMSCGENLAIVLFSHLLREIGEKACALTGYQAGIITDNNFGAARISKVIPTRVKKLIDDGIIPVIAGFQGLSTEGEITTLGRNGSDITAIAMGIALDAEIVEIYKNTAGVKTLDPSKFKDTRVVPRLTFEEAGEMADEGARVIHKRCISLANEHGISLLVKSLEPGTGESLITRETSGDAFEKSRVVSSVVCVTDLCHFSAFFGEKPNPEKTRAMILRALGEENVSLDVINIVGYELHFVVMNENIDKTKKVFKKYDIPYRFRPDVVKVAVVGIGMKGTPGVMAKVQESLLSAGVDILHSTDSHITLSCLVKGDDLGRAVEALKKEFSL
ncbi:MAG: aspartate kinase [Candidatus Eremiobacteraeota bacterium]|nr:aspartate kinase [Candidatus Eremiobacteraeota bacterium]